MTKPTTLGPSKAVTKPNGIEALFDAEAELRQAAWSYGRWRDATTGGTGYTSEGKAKGLNDARKRLRIAAVAYAKFVDDIEDVWGP
jgi:hypothetical protein